MWLVGHFSPLVETRGYKMLDVGSVYIMKPLSVDIAA